MSGINDAHLHLGEGARLLRVIDLSGAGSLRAMLDRIAGTRAAAAEKAWLTGGGWDESLWSTPALPTRYDLDPITGDHPAIFVRVDIHVAVANSAALARAGITNATADPPGGAIDRDPSGIPTGILRERAARELVERHIEPATRSERMHSLRQVCAAALRHGITSVQDNSTDADVAALAALHAAGELPLRVSEWLPFDAPLEELETRRASLPNDRFLRAGMLKAFLDGSLGSRTAAMLEPYADAPDETGIPLYGEDELTQRALERAQAGFPLGFHAIGDRAVAMALSVFAAVRKAVPGSLRLRVEHAQTASPGAFAAARAASVIASMQPNHLLSDLRWAGSRLGPERAARAYAWRSFLAAGVPLAFGTDYPVEPITPFRGLYAALTREPEAGGALWFPQQRLTAGEAIHAMTQGAAYAEGTEGWKGRLVPGHVADLAVLDRDLLLAAADPRSILDTQVLRTVVGGRTVYWAGSAR